MAHDVSDRLLTQDGRDTLQLVMRDIWHPVMHELGFDQLHFLYFGTTAELWIRIAPAPTVVASRVYSGQRYDIMRVVGRWGYAAVEPPFTIESLDTAAEKALCVAWFDSPYL